MILHGWKIDANVPRSGPSGSLREDGGDGQVAFEHSIGAARHALHEGKHVQREFERILRRCDGFIERAGELGPPLRILFASLEKFV
jgi:hypothetical protein